MCGQTSKRKTASNHFFFCWLLQLRNFLPGLHMWHDETFGKFRNEVYAWKLCFFRIPDAVFGKLCMHLEQHCQACYKKERKAICVLLFCMCMFVPFDQLDLLQYLFCCISDLRPPLSVIFYDAYIMMHTTQ